jgi:hypothetical protein
MAIKGVGFQEVVKILGSVEPLSRSTQPPAPSPKGPDLSLSPSEDPPFIGQYHKYFVASDCLAKHGSEPRTLEHFGVGEYNKPARGGAHKAKFCFRQAPEQTSSSVIELATHDLTLIRSIEVFGAVRKPIRQPASPL